MKHMIDRRDLSTREHSALEGSFSHQITECRVPDAIMFGYPTRLVDSWTPAPERILLPGYLDPGRQLDFRLGEGVTYRSFGPTGELDRSFKRIVRDWLARWSPVRRVEGTVVCDSRPLYEGNLAHLTYAIVPRVLLCRELIRKHTGRDVPLTVVFRKRAHPLARKLMDYLHIPAIYTDAYVRGTTIEVDCGPTYSSIVIYDPRLFDFPIDGYETSTPDKIFISRRGPRSLINDDDVSDYLRSRGFVRFTFEDLSLNMQFSLMRNAREVVAIHGAALGGLVFNRHGVGPEARPGDGVRLIELFGAGYIVRPYRHLAARYNGTWAAVRGQLTSRIVRDLDEDAKPRSHASTPFRIHIESLQEALDLVSRAAT